MFLLVADLSKICSRCYFSFIAKLFSSVLELENVKPFSISHFVIKLSHGCNYLSVIYISPRTYVIFTTFDSIISCNAKECKRNHATFRNIHVVAVYILLSGSFYKLQRKPKGNQKRTIQKKLGTYQLRAWQGVRHSPNTVFDTVPRHVFRFIAYNREDILYHQLENVIYKSVGLVFGTINSTQCIFFMPIEYTNHISNATTCANLTIASRVRDYKGVCH